MMERAALIMLLLLSGCTTGLAGRPLRDTLTDEQVYAFAVSPSLWWRPGRSQVVLGIHHGRRVIGNCLRPCRYADDVSIHYDVAAGPECDRIGGFSPPRRRMLTLMERWCVPEVLVDRDFVKIVLD